MHNTELRCADLRETVDELEMMMDELVETVLDEASSRVLSDMSSESSHSDAEESDAPKFVRQDVPLPE